MSVTANSAPRAVPESKAATGTAFSILVAISISHLLNDLVQSLVPAIYPILKDQFRLDFGQIGIITLTWQLTASVLQPVVGIGTDRHPQPFSLAIGMGFTLLGLVGLAFAGTYAVLLVAVAAIGVGSAVFHPESSRVARMASGGRHGLAQSLFQVGGNVGQAIGPLLAAFVILPHGQSAISWFSVAALAGILILTRVGFWYREHRRANAGRTVKPTGAGLPRPVVVRAILILMALVFSKFFYTACLSTYYTFYVIDRFGVSVGTAQVQLFAFLAAVAVGTLVGGPIGDRIGRKTVIWVSILGVLPFTLALPYLGETSTVIATMAIGAIMASAFPAIIVYAQELLPAQVGMVAGLFFGFAFGMGAVGAAVLGELIDATSLDFVFRVSAWLPAIGLLAAFLPDVRRAKAA